MPYISVSTGPNALRGANPTLGPLRVVDDRGRHVGPPTKRLDLRRPAPSSVPSRFVGPPSWAMARGLRGLGEYRDMEMYKIMDQSMSGSGCAGCGGMGVVRRRRGVRGLGGTISTSLGLPDTLAGINLDWILYAVAAYFAYSIFLSKPVGKARRAYSRARRKASDRDKARADYEARLADIG